MTAIKINKEYFSRRTFTIEDRKCSVINKRRNFCPIKFISILNYFTQDMELKIKSNDCKLIKNFLVAKNHVIIEKNNETNVENILKYFKNISKILNFDFTKINIFIFCIYIDNYQLWIKKSYPSIIIDSINARNDSRCFLTSIFFIKLPNGLLQCTVCP